MFYFDEIKRSRSSIILFACLSALTVSLAVMYYCSISVREPKVYGRDANVIKIIYSMIWFTILFLGIDHTAKKVSTFSLGIVFVLQIVPISVIYALGNNSTIYYSCVCFTFWLAEFIVWIFPVDTNKKNRQMFADRRAVNSVTVIICCLITMALFGYILLKNGLPSLAAVNIYNVYELRSSGSFVLSGNMTYLMKWVPTVILPFLFTKCVIEKKYFLGIILIGMMYTIYLYTGHKTFLFLIPIVIVTAFWGTREKAYFELFDILCIGMTAVVLLFFFSPIGNAIFEKVFSLFSRRVMLLSAQNKFTYFDFFSNNPKMYLQGIFPTWMFDFSNSYSGQPIGQIISGRYYDLPFQNSNTGFFAEFYARFGYIGFILGGAMLGAVIRAFDLIQRNTGYRLGIGITVYVVISLGDGYLISSLVLGALMMTFIIGSLFREEHGIEGERIAAERAGVGFRLLRCR